MKILLAILLLVVGTRCFAAPPVYLGAITDYITNSGGTITFVYSNRARMIFTRGNGQASINGVIISDTTNVTGVQQQTMVGPLAITTTTGNNDDIKITGANGGITYRSADAGPSGGTFLKNSGETVKWFFGAGWQLGDSQFEISEPGGPRLIVYPGGAIGIGASTPLATLHLTNLLAASDLFRVYTKTGNGALSALTVSSNRTVMLGASAITNTPPAGYAAFFSATNTGVVEMMVIDSGGNVTQLSAHPLDAPPVFYITTNWVGGVPNISKTLKMYAGVIEWQNQSLASLIDKWRTDNELFATNYFASLTAGQRTVIRTARQRMEPFAVYNARMGLTNGDPRALVRWSWATIQTQRQTDYDAARAAEGIAFNTPLRVPTTNGIVGYTNAVNTNIVIRPIANVRETKPDLVDWDAP